MALFRVLLWINLVCVSNVFSSPSKSRTDFCNKSLFDASLQHLVNRHPENGSHLKICSSEQSCCSPELEERLQLQIGPQYQNLLRRHNKHLNYFLQSTAHSVEQHVIDLIRHSENKTQTVFQQVYQSMSVLATDAVSKMYAGILRHATSNDPAAYDADVAIYDFFQDVFPLVYHHIVNPHLRDYSQSYKRCLRSSWLEIKPFGDIPKELATKVEDTMTVVRFFLLSLRTGSDALNKTNILFPSRMHPRCREELVRMSLCPSCRNLHAKPCSGYCLNVMRGCLRHFSSVLDLPWSGFVDALEQLLQRQVSLGSYSATIQLLANLEESVRSLDVKASEAIMKAMMEGTQLEQRAKKACGPPSWSDDDSQPQPPEVVSSPELLEPSKIKVTPHTAGKRFSEKIKESEKTIATQLQHFLEILRKSQSHYGSMAESLCSDESFADTRDTTDCWNGHRVGEYTKTVVAAGESAQKYNPELPPTNELPDDQIIEISNNLRNMRQMMMRLLTRQPESDSFMRDEEGSGDGGGGGTRYPSDDEENWDRNEGSGSGEQPPDGRSDPNSNIGIRGGGGGGGGSGGGSGGDNELTPKHSGSQTRSATVWLVVLLFTLSLRHFHGR